MTIKSFILNAVVAVIVGIILSPLIVYWEITNKE